MILNRAANDLDTLRAVTAVWTATFFRQTQVAITSIVNHLAARFFANCRTILAEDGMRGCHE